MKEIPTLHLGITLAGAVSAGAYTAGVVDYLIEAITHWETAKKEEAHLAPEDKTVPPHRVQIDVIGGASAGGITAALTALSFFSLGIQAVDHPNESAAPDFKPVNNLLFDTWVNLNGSNDGREVIRRMLTSTDLRGAEGIPSLLNSIPIDNVSQQAISHVKNKPRVSWPSFVAPDLEILLTLCSLRGIQVGIEFNSGNSSWSAAPSHQMSIHKQFARFATQKFTNTDRAMLIAPDDEKSLQQLIEFAKATSAFPAGLRARHVKLSRGHIRHQFNKFLQLKEATLNNIFNETVPEIFEFTSVDGGTLNNEPFGEIAAIMTERGIGDFAMILVDPFPNFGENYESYKFQQYLKDQAFPLIGALRNQGALKENDLREIGRLPSGELPAEYRKNMIYPTRHRFDEEKKEWVTEKDTPIACGALGGFSGFLSREFRHHDYFLGRKNCRNFLRGYFTMEYNLEKPAENHKIFKDWTPAMVQKYKAYWRRDQEPNIVYLPIIPLPDFIAKEDAERGKFSDEKTFEEEMKKIARTMPVTYPISQRSLVNRLRFPLACRLFWMAHRLSDNLFAPRDPSRSKWWRKAIGFILKWAVRLLLLLSLILPFLFVYFSGKILRAVRRDLRKNGLLPPRK